MNELVIMKDKQAVTSSLQVSEGFEKQHGHIIRDIEQLEKDVSNFGEMFSVGNEPDSYGRDRKVYFMNRDGFTLLAMGFTGSKALQFKLKYIEAFNRMEEHIKQQLDVSQLSPDLQMFHKLFTSIAEQQLEFTYQKQRQEKLESKVDSISSIVRMDTKDWRKNANNILRKIAIKQGGFDKFKEIGNESYQMLELRAKCDLDRRLENRRKNMIVQGVGKTTVKRFNKLDVIAEDARLTEIYLSVIKDMAIKYKVDFDEVI